MAEYIEREAAIKAIESVPDGNWRSIRYAKEVKAIPAADVALVRHGHWVPDKEDIEWGNSLIHYRCSECKERPHFDKDKYKFILSSYCPNCGADMRDNTQKTSVDEEVKHD